jgi:Tfp pilus assembly protein PilN
MININLLPTEYRKAERTPLIVFLPLIAGLICVLSAGSLAGYVRFSWLAETRSQRVQLDQAYREKKPRLAYHENLLKEESEYKKQAETITNIASSRILMTRKLDELCNLVAEGDAGQHGGFSIWLKDLSVKPAREQRGRGRSKGPKSGGDIVFKGYALADHSPLQDMNKWHRAILNSEMYRDGYIGITDPRGSVQDFGDELVPKKGWSFEMTLAMKDPAERLKEKKEAARNLRAEGKKTKGRR